MFSQFAKYMLYNVQYILCTVIRNILVNFMGEIVWQLAVCMNVLLQARIYNKSRCLVLAGYSLPVILSSMILNLPRIINNFQFAEKLLQVKQYWHPDDFRFAGKLAMKQIHLADILISYTEIYIPIPMKINIRKITIII